MRTITSLNRLDWRFARLDNPSAPLPGPSDPAWQPVQLPHVWNKDDASQAGCCVYTASFEMELQPDRQHFLEFQAVAGVCRVVLNGVLLGEHRGGYAAFRFQLDQALTQGANLLTVYADNTRYPDINPLTGDFDNYGGIYRDVQLIETADTHFDLLYHGTCGVMLDASADGTLTMTPHIVGGEDVEARYTILDGGQTVAQLETAAVSGQPQQLKVEHPHLWDGLTDPHCYTLRAQLLRDGALCDRVEVTFGFRSVAISAKEGFSLNGQHLHLNGVAKHQDHQGAGNAPTREQLDEDMAIIRDLGANAVRLSHYQHPQYFYDLCDQEGLVVWAEIPMLAMPDGNDGVFENAKSQLTELILQNRHHPSICFWGIQNEIAMMGESLEMYDKVEQLNALAKQLDPSRLTTAANLYCVKNNSQLNFIPDCIGYNLYYGWYYGEMTDYAGFIRQFHADNPGVALGFSEYGVDCNLAYHSEHPKRKDYTEEYQALYHETVYPQLTADSGVWSTFVWNLFDFGSSIRDEGGTKGQNCKGLVTWDRQTKKDAFYYYKAQWSKDPFVHIAGRRFAKRSGAATEVKVYSNCPVVQLTVNGKAYPAQEGQAVFRFQVLLDADTLDIQARAGSCTDQITLTRVDQPEPSYIYIDPNPEIDVKNWFTLQQGQEDLFPEGRFSIMDPIGDILDDPRAYALLEEALPAIAHDERSRKYRSMGLIRTINRMPHKPDEDFLKDLNRRLAQIEKK